MGEVDTEDRGMQTKDQYRDKGMPLTEALLDTGIGVVHWLRSLVPLPGAPALSDTPARAAADACCTRSILVLPGILENHRYLAPLLAHLRAQGHPLVLVPRLGQNLHSLPDSVELAFEALTAAGGPCSVILAHSKGGLIGRTMLADPRSHGLLRGMVAVASPFRGSLLWPALQDTALLRASPLEMFHPSGTALAWAGRPDPVARPIISLCPRDDQMVSEGSVLPGAQVVELPVAGHFRSVHDPRTWPLIHRQLDRCGDASEQSSPRPSGEGPLGMCA